jgi:integrase
VESPLPTVTVTDVADLAEVVCAKRYGPSAELSRIQYCCSLLRTMNGDLPAHRFGPLALRALQEAMVSGWTNGVHRPPLARREVNRRIMTVRRVFRIGVSYELVPPSTLTALSALDPLRRGHTPARERARIRPVAEEIYLSTLPKLSLTVRTMAEVQAATGMRTGELVIMRVADVDRSSEPWTYTPRTHKNAWRDEGDEAPREIPFGPRVRAMLAPMIVDLKPDDFVFSPKREFARRAAEKRAARKTRVQPSQMNRRKPTPKRAPRDYYSVLAYARAIARGCVRAGVPSWRPSQLRHGRLTLVRRSHGIEASQAVGGHASISATQIYAEVNRDRARHLAETMG